jgi:hypothetical protein
MSESAVRGRRHNVRSAYLGPIAGVACCGSATCGSAEGNVDGGAAFTFCGAGSDGITVCVSSRSVGVVGGGRAMSATTGPFRHPKRCQSVVETGTQSTTRD